MTRVYVGVGSNIDRDTNIRAGINAIKHQFGLIEISSVYESEAYGFEGDNFYNLVVGFDTELSLIDLTEKLREIEYLFGRKRMEERFLSRTLDLDLLLYNDLIRHDEVFDLPRQDIIQYSFVLCPLAEIAGHEIHPELQETYNDLWQKFDRNRQKLWKVDF